MKDEYDRTKQPNVLGDIGDFVCRKISRSDLRANMQIAPIARAENKHVIDALLDAVNYVDKAVGTFLKDNGKARPKSSWTSLASDFDGKFQRASLRKVDRRPRPDFVKAYMHNGYLKSLKEVVHFHNASQSLPHCPQGSQVTMLVAHADYLSPAVEAALIKQ